MASASKNSILDDDKKILVNNLAEYGRLLGIVMYSLRKANGISQAKLARMVAAQIRRRSARSKSVTPSLICKIEKGSVCPSATVFFATANLLNMRLSSFFRFMETLLIEEKPALMEANSGAREK